MSALTELQLGIPQHGKWVDEGRPCRLASV